MLNKAFIQFVMLFSPLLRSLGVDPFQLKTILYTKCTVDDRRPTGLSMYKKSSEKTSELGKNIMLFLLGAMLSGILFIQNLLVAHTLYIAAFMIYLVNSLIIDFSNVLIDVRDHYFIASRPVNDKTVAVARILHILIYLCKMFLPLVLPAVLVVFIKDGLVSGGLFLIELLSASTLSIFSVYIIYMLMMQFMKPQKFRDIISYFQIAFSTFILASYMIFPRMIEGANLAKISILDYKLSYFLPPVWIATLQDWTVQTVNLSSYLLSALAILTPVVCLVAITKFLSGNFSNKLSMMGSATDDRPADKKSTRETKTYADKLAAFFTSSPLEELGFKITWKLTSRMREFKVRTYPHIAYVPIYFIYFFFLNSDRSWSEQWHHLGQTPATYLFLIYSLSFVTIVLLRQITKSEDFKAAWIYQLSSNSNPGRVLSGMIKSLFAKYVLPAAVVITILVLYIWGFGTSLNILYAFTNVFLVIFVVALISARKFPFSEPSTMQQQKGRMFINILLILIPFGLGFFQSYITNYPAVLIILSVIFTGINWGLFRIYKGLSWSDLKS